MALLTVSSPNYKRCMCSRLSWICFHDGRKYKSFEGLRLIFLAIGLLTVNYNSSFWDLRLIWVIFENNSEKMTQMYICFINAKKRKETSGISLFCSLIIVEIWVYNIMSTFEIWILRQSQSHGQESDFWKWERNKLI